MLPCIFIQHISIHCSSHVPHCWYPCAVRGSFLNDFMWSMLSSVALVQVFFPAVFVFLQLLDIPPLISTHTACLTWRDIKYLWHYHTLSYPWSFSNVWQSVYIEVGLFFKCIHNCSSGSSYQIILGTNQWNPLGAGALLLSSTVTIVHPKYDPNTIENDIALIKLPIRVNFTCEYCHILTKVKIILLVLEQIKCFLFAT